jgi:AcrR family transcriptional regulator
MEERLGRGVRMRDVADAAGVSRQAVYDHFGSRAQLILEATHYVDEIRGLGERKRRFEAATTGQEALEAYIEFWGNFIPEIHSIARALRADRESDPAAAAAWDDRMGAVRASCQIVVQALERDAMLAPGWSVNEATDWLWTMLSISNWEQLTIECGWTQRQYIARMHELTMSMLVKRREGRQPRQ